MGLRPYLTAALRVEDEPHVAPHPARQPALQHREDAEGGEVERVVDVAPRHQPALHDDGAGQELVVEAEVRRQRLALLVPAAGRGFGGHPDHGAARREEDEEDGDEQQARRPEAAYAADVGRQHCPDVAHADVNATTITMSARHDAEVPAAVLAGRLVGPLSHS